MSPTFGEERCVCVAANELFRQPGDVSVARAVSHLFLAMDAGCGFLKGRCGVVGLVSWDVAWGGGWDIGRCEMGWREHANGGSGTHGWRFEAGRGWGYGWFGGGFSKGLGHFVFGSLLTGYNLRGGIYEGEAFDYLKKMTFDIRLLWLLSTLSHTWDESFALHAYMKGLYITQGFYILCKSSSVQTIFTRLS